MSPLPVISARTGKEDAAGFMSRDNQSYLGHSITLIASSTLPCSPIMLICASRFQPQAAVDDAETMKELGESDIEHDVNNDVENDAEENDNEDSSVENQMVEEVEEIVNDGKAEEIENEGSSVENEGFVEDVLLMSTQRTVNEVN